jgi:hypothetical protein
MKKPANTRVNIQRHFQMLVIAPLYLGPSQNAIGFYNLAAAALQRRLSVQFGLRDKSAQLVERLKPR